MVSRRRRSDARLLVVGVLVISLLVTLVTRLFTVQVIGAEHYRAAASTNRVRAIVTSSRRLPRRCSPGWRSALVVRSRSRVAS